MRKTTLALACLVGLSLGTPASAQSPAQLRMLEARVKLLEAENARLKAEIAALKKGANGGQAAVPKEMQAIYDAVNITNATVVGGPFSAGDEVSIRYSLTNTGSETLNVPLDKSYSRPFYLIGTRQHWIQRLGRVSEIPAISPRIARRGDQYAAGGSIVISKAKLAPLDGVPVSVTIDTKDYPAGKYEYVIEYKPVRGKEPLKTEKLTFEVRP